MTSTASRRNSGLFASRTFDFAFCSSASALSASCSSCVATHAGEYFPLGLPPSSSPANSSQLEKNSGSSGLTVPKTFRAGRVAVWMSAARVHDGHVAIHLRPVIIVGRRRTMRRGHERQNPAGGRQRALQPIPRRGQIVWPQARRQPSGFAVRVVKIPAPDAVGVIVFFKIAAPV